MALHTIVSLAVVLAGVVNAQLPIPEAPPGFTVGGGSADAGVQLETYIDLMCPASKAAYPGLKKLVAHYKASELRVKFVLFPLPYHQHSFTAAESAYWNKQTKDLTAIQVTDKLYALAKETFPALTHEQWAKGMTGFGGTDADSAARVSWKYTCSRTVSGTPMYTLNGVPLDADSDWSVDDWRRVIDPLVKLPIPGKPPGFTVGGGSADAGVQLETFVDLLCPDSKSAYPGLKKLAEHYARDELRVKFVLFPLPYHQHAFAAAEAAFTITTALGDDRFTLWLETMYANQDIFWNKPTKDLTPVQVTDKLRELAQKTFPSLSNEQWAKGMTGYGGTDADDRTRAEWKYACSRGKSGTPLYTLNGMPFDADPTWGFDDWFQVIDPLVQANAKREGLVQKLVLRMSGVPPAVPDRQVLHFARHETLAAASVCVGVAGGARPCEFAPGRAMCCLAHEACVLRSGCTALA
ncbi:hypothetical protein PybrP1_012785 [[Pythium] brassicae (nom. inval.)]|nr:hypothetical protein PybrP1_012785 [[Pythium] brassicae (nom. inval.)]